MKLGSRVARFVLLFAFLAVNAASAQKKSSYADTVVRHGRIYTLNPIEAWAEALAIRGPFANWFDVNPHSINQTKVLTTIAGGRVVFQSH
jgi:hypothetical protein